MRRGIRIVVGIAGMAALTTAPVTAQDAGDPVRPYRDQDHSVVARNILPPGQGRHLNALEFAQFQLDGTLPDHLADQRALYEDLVAAAPTLTEQDLQRLFKDASFGVPDDDIASVTQLRDGATVIVRDASFGVPHVYGRSRPDATFGAGYASAQDRLFMMDVLRHLGRGRLSEFLGASDSNLAMDRAQRKLADYSEDELQAMIDRVAGLDPELGPIAASDLEAYIEGINTFITDALIDPTRLPAVYGLIQQVPQPWTPTDVVAVATLIGGDFSPGGGGQLANAGLFRALEEQGFSSAEARQIITDLRMANDPEAPVTTDTPFPFLDDHPAPDPAAVVVPDDPQAALAIAQASVLPGVIDTPLGPIRLDLGGQHSNALLVTADHSATGDAIAVMGPQVGYFAPEILLELDLHAPGFHARGAAFPGISLYVLLGRGTNYAWSATTASGDHRDIRAVPLCEPDGSQPSLDSQHYLDDGTCVAMETRTDSWLAKPSAVGLPEDPTAEDAIVVEMTTERTRHGVVQGRAMVDGEPWAFALQRSSYDREVDATLTFASIHDPERVGSIEDLRAAFRDHFSFSFNWFLVHDDDIAFQLTGLYPVPPDGVDLDLPMHGDSRWDPTATLPRSAQPFVVNPDSGYITNWNGKQAPRFRAADVNYAFGPTQRVTLLTDGVLDAMADDGKVSLVELTRAMALGGTQDLYGVEVLPLLLTVLGDVDDARLDAAVELLDDWSEGGAHRRDLDGDGQVDESAPVVLFDEWWPRATRAVFEPALGAAFDEVPLSITERARPGGSAYFGAFHGQLHRDLRQVLGQPVTEPASRTYCGNGDLDACRQALRTSLDEALAAVEQSFGPNPADWDFDESSQDIAFSELGAHSVESMAWQNRPTFQQVLAFGQADSGGPVGDPPTPTPLPATGAGALLAGLLLVLAALGPLPRRRS